MAPVSPDWCLEVTFVPFLKAEGIKTSDPVRLVKFTAWGAGNQLSQFQMKRYSKSLSRAELLSSGNAQIASVRYSEKSPWPKLILGKGIW